MTRKLAGVLGVTLALAHLGGAYVALGCLAAAPTGCSLPIGFGIPPPFSSAFFVELFKHLMLMGTFLYALLLAFWSFNRGPSSLVKPVVGVFALSLAVAILLAADSSLRPAGTSTAPANVASLVYALVTERQALLALSLLLVVGVAVLTYQLMRAAFSVEYSGAGVQIKLPGQTVYYVPVFPQVSWQDTGIALQKGEKVTIEVTGQVSPGALHLATLTAWTEHMKAFVAWQTEFIAGTKTVADWRNIKPPASWPYSGPEGYSPEWYAGEKKIAVLKEHDLYKKDSFFKDDALLTVRGLPHNTVIGFIQAFGNDRPRNTERGESAYNWASEQDKSDLLLLSAPQYPLIEQEISRSGKLWVVINDVDVARWDNAGMFFLKLSRRAWL